MSEITIAEDLLKRKELQGEVDVLKHIKNSDVFEIKTQRKQITDNIDDIVAQVPKLTASQVTAEFDFYARQHRLVDAAIQQANWTTKIEVQSSVLEDFKC